MPESIRFNLIGELKEGVMSRDIIMTIVDDIGGSGALYKVMEFTGEGAEKLSLDSRMTICNSANQAGAKTGIFNPDEKTLSYVRETIREPFEVVRSDHDAQYADTFDYELSKIKPKVAKHPSPLNIGDITDVEEVEVHQAVIGSCASGRMEDMRIAAQILEGRGVHPNVRMIVIPSSQEIGLEMAREGLTEIFIRAGATICAPSCGPCAGLHSGILAAGEVCISTTVTKSPGRMGSDKAEIYLASAATVAASAVEGKITDPRKFL